MCQKSSCVLDVSRKPPADPDLRIRNFLAVSARLDAADSTLLSSQMEQIKRANRMYTNDSIHLRTSLSIPVLLDCGGGVESLPDPSLDEEAAGNVRSDRKREDGGGTAEELSPEDFLKRLDGLIQQSKQAAVRGCRDAEERLVVPGAPSQSRNAGACRPDSGSLLLPSRFASLEEVCGGATPAWRPLLRSQSALSPPRGQQLTPHGAVPLTITRLTKNLREKEDEIFQL